MYSHQPRPRGFTLIELLVVIAIVAVLAAILFPVFVRSHHGPGPGSRCRSNMKQLASALAMYTMDYDNRYPPHAYTQGARSVTLPFLLHPYLKNRGVWQCTMTLKQGDQTGAYDGSPDDASVSYGYNWLALSPNGVGVSEKRIGKPTETVALVESNSYLAAPPPLIPALGGTPPVYRHNRSTIIAWADGHVKSEGPGKLEAIADAEGGKPTGDGIDCYQYWNLR